MISAQSAQRHPAKPPANEEVRVTSPRTPERKVLATITLPRRTVAPDVAYRRLLGHTTTCAGCRVGASCPTAVRLGRAWREVRRG